MGILDFLLGGGGQQDPRQAQQPYLPGRTRMPFDIPMQSGQSGQATVPAQMTNPLERPNPWIPGQGSTQAEPYRNESVMPEWMDRYVPSPRGAMTGNPFATQQEINRGMSPPMQEEFRRAIEQDRQPLNPVTFNPGLREGWNYPMSGYANDQMGPPPPPPEAVMPPGWQPIPPEGRPQPRLTPQMLDQMRRARPTPPLPAPQAPQPLWQEDRRRGRPRMI